MEIQIIKRESTGTGTYAQLCSSVYIFKSYYIPFKQACEYMIIILSNYMDHFVGIYLYVCVSLRIIFEPTGHLLPSSN